MHGLSKSRIMAHRQCAKRLWLQTYRPELASESPQARIAMENGNRIGEAARTIFPGGTLIDDHGHARRTRPDASGAGGASGSPALRRHVRISRGADPCRHPRARRGAAPT